MLVPSKTLPLQPTPSLSLFAPLPILWFCGERIKGFRLPLPFSLPSPNSNEVEMSRFLQVELKSYKIWTDNAEGPRSFSITERAKGKPHVISFEVSLCEMIIAFLNEAMKARRDMGFRDIVRSQKSTIVLNKGSNNWAGSLESLNGN